MLPELDPLRSKPQDIPRHWLVLRDGQIPHRDPKTGEIVKTERGPANAGNVKGSLPRPLRPLITWHAEGDFFEFETQKQIDRSDVPVQIIDPKTGQPKWRERADGVIEFEYILRDPDKNGYRPTWNEDVGVTHVLPLLDEEYEQLKGWSKTKRMSRRGELHYAQPENMLAWMRPYHEWEAYGLTVPSDYEPPVQPEEPKEQLVANELKDLMALSRAQQKQIDKLMQQNAALVAAAAKAG